MILSWKWSQFVTNHVIFIKSMMTFQYELPGLIFCIKHIVKWKNWYGENLNRWHRIKSTTDILYISHCPTLVTRGDNQRTDTCHDYFTYLLDFPTWIHVPWESFMMVIFYMKDERQIWCRGYLFGHQNSSVQLELWYTTR